MGGSISRIFSPVAAKTMMSNSNSAALKSALQNYIKAVNELNNNARTENKLVALMNDTRIGLTNSYKKRIANAIASIVAKAPRVASKAAMAAAGVEPATPAAVAVNNLAKNISNLNAFMNGFKGGNANALAKFYQNSGRNYRKNRGTNSQRNGGARYANLWNNLNRRATDQGFAELPGETAVSNEANKQAAINKALAEIDAVGNNVNKLRGIKKRLNNAGFNRDQAPASAITKYNGLTNRLAANQALKNANALTVSSNQATINRVLNNLRKIQSRVPNSMRPSIASKIANVERMSLLKRPMVAAGETGGAAPLELNINVPGENRKVKVRRNNPGANWNFVNNANKKRYKLNNRNKNVPKIRNTSTTELFRQGN